MGFLIVLLLPIYTGIFYHFVLHYYWAIPINIFIALILDALTIFLIILIMMPICKALPLQNKFKHKYIRNLLGLGCFFINVHYKFEGLENLPEKGAFVLYPNHKSYVDIMVLFVMLNRPATFISKPENFKIPLVGKYMETIGCIGLNRDNDREAVKSILAGIQLLKQGLPMIIFPEGGIKSRTDEHMIEIKAGAYKLATKPQVPIIPISLVGMTQIKKNAPFKRSNVKVIVHKPIMPSDYNDLNTHEIGERVFETVNSVF